MLYGVAPADDTGKPATSDLDIVREANERWHAVKDWQGVEDERSREDTKFANGDSRNAWQWPSKIYQERTADGNDMPCLTINNTRVHNDIVINELSKQNYGIKIRPTGGKASYKSASVMQSLINRIQYLSRFPSQRRRVAEHQVDGGLGYMLIETAFVHEKSFDQDIYLRAARDPTGVYLDPWIREPDGSDANFGFVFERMPRKEFNRKYPKYKNRVGAAPLDAAFSMWLSDKEVMIVKYFRKLGRADTLISYRTDNGDTVSKLASEIREESGREIYDQLLAQIEDGTLEGRTRAVVNNKVEWFLIAGDQIVERGEWAGKYIPICRCVGREAVIDGTLDRKGMTRSLIDANRMLNYNAPLALSTPLPTPSGWTTIGAVKAGDWVFDENGRPVQVAGTSPVFLHRKCYSIEFDSGTIVADAEHKWLVEERAGRIAAGTVWKTRTVTTADLRPDKHFVCSALPLNTEPAELPIHPYVLGVWLGDGSSLDGRITCHSDEAKEIRTNIIACGFNTSEPVTKQNSAYFGVFGLRSKLKELGVFNNKHVPQRYMRSSVEQRLALLQGLMDTDGCLSREKQCVFVNTNVKIANAVMELLVSLGIKGQMQVVEASKRMFPQGRACECQETYRIAFSADPDQPVFRLRRKADRQSEQRPTHWRRTKRHRIRSISEVASVPVKCLGINSESHLFLVGNNMVPTHNSMSVEIVALQPKSPFMAPARAIEGQEQYKTMNINGFPVILYNDLDEEAPAGMQEIKPPFRIDPPKHSEAHITGMQMAERWGMMVSGQFQAQMGENDTQSAASGKAINERQQQGDTATYHFPEHQADMLRFIGVQLLDLIPKIYDTERTLHVLDDEGEKRWVLINPKQQDVIQEIAAAKEDEEAVRIAFNPAIGEYECVSDPGPDFATQRQEGWNALSQILMQNAPLASVVGDQLFKFGDFPGADAIAERLQKEIKATKPYLFDDAIEPQVLALQQQNQKLVQLNGELMAKLADANLKVRGRDEKRDIEAFNAETNRMKAQIEALAKVVLTPAQRSQMEHELEMAGRQHVYDMIQQANAPNVKNEGNGSAE